MNIEQLQRFLVVAECLNFTAAAERLYIGQSTISRQIAALEHELGVILLIRGPRSVELTEAGKVLYQEGTKLMKYIDRVKDKVVEAGQGGNGSLRITTVPAYFDCVNDLCLAMKQAHPNIKINLSYSKYVNVCQDLDLGSADVGVSYSFLDPQDDAYGVIPLAESLLYVLCSKQHWIADHPDGIHMDDLRNSDIVFGRSSLLMAQRSHPYHGEPPTAEHRENDTMEGDLLMLQTSDKIMILPGSSAKNSRHNLAMIPLLDESLRHKVILLYRKDSSSGPLKSFLEIVEQYLKKK